MEGNWLEKSRDTYLVFHEYSEKVEGIHWYGDYDKQKIEDT